MSPTSSPISGGCYPFKISPQAFSKAFDLAKCWRDQDSNLVSSPNMQRTQSALTIQTTSIVPEDAENVTKADRNLITEDGSPTDDTDVSCDVKTYGVKKDMTSKETPRDNDQSESSSSSKLSSGKKPFDRDYFLLFVNKGKGRLRRFKSNKINPEYEIIDTFNDESDKLKEQVEREEKEAADKLEIEESITALKITKKEYEEALAAQQQQDKKNAAQQNKQLAGDFLSVDQKEEPKGFFTRRFDFGQLEKHADAKDKTRFDFGKDLAIAIGEGSSNGCQPDQGTLGSPSNWNRDTHFSPAKGYDVEQNAELAKDSILRTDSGLKIDTSLLACPTKGIFTFDAGFPFPKKKPSSPATVADLIFKIPSQSSRESSATLEKEKIVRPEFAFADTGNWDVFQFRATSPEQEVRAAGQGPVIASQKSRRPQPCLTFDSSVPRIRGLQSDSASDEAQASVVDDGHEVPQRVIKKPSSRKTSGERKPKEEVVGPEEQKLSRQERRRADREKKKAERKTHKNAGR